MQKKWWLVIGIIIVLVIVLSLSNSVELSPKKTTSTTLFEDQLNSLVEEYRFSQDQVRKDNILTEIGLFASENARKERLSPKKSSETNYDEDDISVLVEQEHELKENELPEAGDEGIPPGCNAAGTGMILTSYVDGEDVPFNTEVYPGSEIQYRVRLITFQDVPPLVFCNAYGGQLSATFPDGTLDYIAGFEESSEIPLYSWDNQFVTFSSSYEVDVCDVGPLFGFVDYGSTVNRPEQENGWIADAGPDENTVSASNGVPLYAATTCPGDLDRNNEVDAADLALLLDSWGSPVTCASADIDEDEEVGPGDLAVLLDWWGSCF